MKYGLIGEHLPHSFSVRVHSLCASYKYELCELAPSELESFMKKADFCAINVTIPYKRDVMKYLDEIDQTAIAVGSVNTVVNRNGKLFGYNTDLFGMRSLAKRENISVSGKKVLILGTGGTAQTARALCECDGAREYFFVSRRADGGRVVSYEEAYGSHSDAEVIINTTPCGMFPNANGSDSMPAEPIDISKFPNLCGVIDAIYNPLRTNLVEKAKARKIMAAGGLYMLVAQGVLASRIFMGEDARAAEKSEELEKKAEAAYKKLLAEKENTVLIGMPASGKSTVGKALAKELGKPFVDTDEMIAEKAGKSITEIFAELGEAGFRLLESEAVRESADLSGAIIATGGGAILKGENVFCLKRNGELWFLDRPLESLLPTEDRPLAKSADAIKKLYAERIGIYRSVADHAVSGERTVDETVTLIKSKFI